MSEPGITYEESIYGTKYPYWSLKNNSTVAGFLNTVRKGVAPYNPFSI